MFAPFLTTAVRTDTLRRMNPLAQYLRRHKLTPRRFAAATGLDRVTIYRIATGKRGVGLVMAGRIERATGGAVPWSAWLKRAA